MEHKILALPIVLVLYTLSGHLQPWGKFCFMLITIVLQRIKVHACRSLQYSEYDSIYSYEVCQASI